MKRFTLFLMLAYVAPLMAQTTQPRTLTLKDAVEIALERNLNVRQAENNVNAAQSGVLSAYGRYLPSLSASSGWNRSQNNSVATTSVIQGQAFQTPAQSITVNSFSAGFGVNYTIFDGFSREANFNRSSETAHSTEQTAMWTRKSIAFQAESDYLNVLRTDQLVGVASENLKRDQQQLDRIVESNKVGSSAIADVYRFQTQVATDELALITSQNDFDKAKADLIALIGLDVSQDYIIADTTISTQISPEELDANSRQYTNFAAMMQQALATRPDYLSAQSGFDAASSGVTSSRSRYFPSIDASAGYSIGNEEFSRISDNKRMNWGLSLSWSLFDGFQTNEAVQTALASRRNAELSLLQTERDINVQLKKALLDLDAARKQYDVTQKGLTSAVEDRKIAEERYNLGAGTLLDFLTANANYVKAASDRVNASYNYLLARENVKYILGTSQN